MGGVLMKRWICSVMLAAFTLTSVLPSSYAQSVLSLLPPGQMVALSPAFNPPVLKGIKVYPDNPLRFDFILDKGDDKSTDDQIKIDSTRLIKYFLASLTIPEKDLWVNLSPYEKDRIVPEAFGQTEMGRDLLAQDYLLKQITASVIYPEGDIGKKFWRKIYALAQEKYGTTDIPVDTFNKVWIVPEKAVVYENGKVGAAYVTESRLKVMLETDYLAQEKNPVAQTGNETNEIAKEVMRRVVIPELECEVNEGKNFAKLRQVYQSLILATWYKKKIKQSLLSEVYVDRNKTAGVNIADPKEAEKIWGQYVEAFRSGVFNYIADKNEDSEGFVIPTRYVAGGVRGDMAMAFHIDNLPPDLMRIGDNLSEIEVSLGVASRLGGVDALVLDVETPKIQRGRRLDRKSLAMAIALHVLFLVGFVQYGVNWKIEIPKASEKPIMVTLTDLPQLEDSLEKIDTQDKSSGDQKPEIESRSGGSERDGSSGRLSSGREQDPLSAVAIDSKTPNEPEVGESLVSPSLAPQVQAATDEYQRLLSEQTLFTNFDLGKLAHSLDPNLPGALDLIGQITSHLEKQKPKYFAREDHYSYVSNLHNASMQLPPGHPEREKALDSLFSSYFSSRPESILRALRDQGYSEKDIEQMTFPDQRERLIPAVLPILLEGLSSNDEETRKSAIRNMQDFGFLNPEKLLAQKDPLARLGFFIYSHLDAVRNGTLSPFNLEKIYKNSTFQEKTRNYSAEQQYAFARAVDTELQRFNASLSDKNISLAVDFKANNVADPQHIILDEKTAVVVFLHEDFRLMTDNILRILRNNNVKPDQIFLAVGVENKDLDRIRKRMPQVPGRNIIAINRTSEGLQNKRDVIFPRKSGHNEELVLA